MHQHLSETSLDKKNQVGYPSPFVDGVMFCTFQCLQTAVKSYHSHEKYLWNDYIFRTKESQEDLEKSGCMVWSSTMFLSFYLET